MSAFISGATAMAYLVAALLFVRYWREARERLFAMFALAFGVLCANRILLVLVAEAHEARSWFFLVRLVAYLLILAAIIDKNSASRR
jgi:hypothetical protein